MRALMDIQADHAQPTRFERFGLARSHHWLLTQRDARGSELDALGKQAVIAKALGENKES